jgi:hypothetical protein
MGLFAYHTTADNNPSVAYFNRFRVTNPCYTVVATSADVNTGTVQQSQATCALGDYRGDAPVTLTATPATGYHFGGWQGSLVSQNNPLTLLVSDDVTVSARFNSYGVISPPNLVRGGNPGVMVVYDLPVRNTGTTTDTYTLAISRNQWPITAPVTVGPVGPGISQTVAISAQIPASALVGAADVAMLRITSQGDAGQVATTTLTTIVNPVSAFTITLPINGQMGAPQAMVVYEVILTNQGNLVDAFALTVSGNQWPTTAPTTVGPLAPGASVTVTISVTIPAETVNGASDTAQLSFSAQHDPTKSTSVSLTTTVTVAPVTTYRLFLPLATAK